MQHANARDYDWHNDPRINTADQGPWSSCVDKGGIPVLRLTIFIVAMACMSDAVFAQSPAVHSTPPNGQRPIMPTVNHFALEQSQNQKRAKENAYHMLAWVIKVVIIGGYLLANWLNKIQGSPTAETSPSIAVNPAAGSHHLCDMKQVVVPVGLGFYGKAGVVLLTEWEHVDSCRATSNPVQKP